MLRRLLQAAAVLVAVAFAMPALAAAPSCTSLPFVSGSTTYNECVTLTVPGTATSPFLPNQLANAWNNSTSAPVPLAVDPTTLFLGVTPENLPPGASTSALQTSTAASIVQALGTPLQAGGAVVFSAPQHVIVDSQTAAATGAATSALQPALNADGGAQEHVTNFPATQVVAQADQTGSGTLALGTANSVFTIPLTAARGTVGTNIVGLTAGGGTLIPEAQNGPGGAWVTANVIAPGAVAVQAITADGNYSFDGGGHYAVRFRVGTAASAAANATIVYDATASDGIVRETNSATIAANQLGTANQATAQVTVSTTATLVVAARAARRTETIINTSATPMFCGGSSAVTAATGWYLPGAVGASRTWSYAGAVYCITASGSAVISEDELY